MDKPQETKRKGLVAWLAAKKLELFVYFLSVAIVVVVAWPFFTTSIAAGYVGAYYSRLFGGTRLDKSYGEGLHFLLPWDVMATYDARMQSKDYNIVALAKGGLEVKIDMSVLWHINPAEVGMLHTTAGPEYGVRIIDPAVMSAVRSIIGSMEQGRLYDGNPLEIQQEVLNLLNETLIDAPFSIHTILVREVKLPGKMANAISDKFVAEQNVLAQRYRVLEAIEHYKQSFVDAEGVRIAQSIINDGMSEAYLRYLGVQATLELAQSDNAKLVIIGDKDGLPLMLNPDTMAVSESLPKGLSEDDYIEVEGQRMEEFVRVYNEMQDHLGQMSNVLGDLVTNFPEAGEMMDETLIPQVSEVPTDTKGGN